MKRPIVPFIKLFLTMSGIALVFWFWLFTARIRKHDARVATDDYPFCFEQKANVCFHMTTPERDQLIIAVGIFLILMLVNMGVWMWDKRKKYNA